MQAVAVNNLPHLLFGFDPLSESSLELAKLTSFYLGKTSSRLILLSKFHMHSGKIQKGEVFVGRNLAKPVPCCKRRTPVGVGDAVKNFRVGARVFGIGRR